MPDKNSSVEEWLEFIGKNMADRAEVASVPIIEERRASNKISSTGFIINFCDRNFLITCSHCVKDYMPEKYAIFPFGKGRDIYLDSGVWHSDAGLDIAVLPLGSADWNEQCKDVNPISIDDIIINDVEHNDEVLFIGGYPTHLTSINHDFANYKFLTVNTFRKNIDNLDPNRHFAIYWEPNEETLKKDPNIIDAKGLSGSGVWSTRFIKKCLDKEKWQVTDAKLIGIAIEWEKSLNCIIVSKSKHIIDPLNKAYSEICKTYPSISKGISRMDVWHNFSTKDDQPDGGST